MSNAPSSPGAEAPTLLHVAERERVMRLLARTGLLAGMVEGLLAEQVRVQAERAALQSRVRDLEARLTELTQGPLLSSGAFSRIQRAQRARGDVREELRRLRERYVDAEAD